MKGSDKRLSDRDQLISKGLVGILNSSKKRTKKFDLQYYDTMTYDTSGRLVFVCFLEELRTPKSPFEIRGPLRLAQDLKTIINLSLLHSRRKFFGTRICR